MGTNANILGQMAEKAKHINTPVDIIELQQDNANKRSITCCAFMAESYVRIKNAYIFAHMQDDTVFKWEVKNNRFTKCPGNLVLYYDNEYQFASGCINLQNDNTIHFMFGDTGNPKYTPEYAGLTRLFGVIESPKHYCAFDFNFFSENKYYCCAVLESEKQMLFEMMEECIKQNALLSNKGRSEYYA
ncbi:MAG: hypothetical protein LUD81_09890 [Clostridiales bacterium]|nr:hypothetical protein [Clostridiales bacterium]